MDKLNATPIMRAPVTAHANKDKPSNAQVSCQPRLLLNSNEINVILC